ncbi:MAG: hypothetical protein KA144_14155 [Xanthomonadaceae bacterium]|nr:hypothetical protein [Xanthomonadaceae bacterium]
MSKIEDSTVRPLARNVARELTPQEVEKIAGGRIPYHTHATGPNGDDPGDPGSSI